MNSNHVIDDLAVQYVRLVLAMGLHDADYVDAYYGPGELQADVAAEKPSLAVIAGRAGSLLDSLDGVNLNQLEPLWALRVEYLRKQTGALISRARMLQGTRFSFDEEAESLYDATPPEFTEAHFDALIEDVGTLLPGTGEVHMRFDEYKRGFIVARERLAPVFDAAIAEGRRRSMAHLTLPEMDKFTVEYVNDKPWSGYNWYKGNGTSIIQVNIDFPITIDRAVDLACHEGYPGHHVYNSLLELKLARGLGWKEFTVYALFSPQSLIAEGTANFGIEMAFPGNERVEFERDVLFPMAGFDPAKAEHYYRVHQLSQRLGFAGNEAARRYLDGSMTRSEAAGWLVRYALMSPDRAEQRTHFFDKYRSYVINYNLGQQLVQQAIERRGGTTDNTHRRWELYGELLTTPRVPSTL
jgi:hypothetical protein